MNRTTGFRNESRRTEHDRRRGRRRLLRRLAEFRGIRKLNFDVYQKHVQKLYDGPAGAMLMVSSKLSLHEPLVGRLFRNGEIAIDSCRSILDIGSGAGQIVGHLLKYAHPNARIVGIDLSAQMLARARNRLRSRRPILIAADMTELPFADESFDCVTCGWVMEYLPDPVPGLKEICRVLQPGGKLYLLATEDTVAGLMTSHTWRCRTFNRVELKQACESVGLPWKRQLWLTRMHRWFRMGGILVEAVKGEPTESEAISGAGATDETGNAARLMS